MVEYTDEDICRAVMEGKEWRETAHLWGGDDDDADDDATIIPHPSCLEALHAVATIQRFLAPMGDPFARELETILASFGCQTHLEETESLKDTSITDYFTRR